MTTPIPAPPIGRDGRRSAPARRPGSEAAVTTLPEQVLLDVAALNLYRRHLVGKHEGENGRQSDCIGCQHLWLFNKLAQTEAELAVRTGERDDALLILDDLTDPDPCQFDHHGHCQAHGWLRDGECADARAQRLLAQSKSDSGSGS